MSIKKDIIWRIGMLYLGVFLVGITILGKALYIHLVEGQEYREKAGRQSLKDITILPNRGDIYAADGRILASSVPYYEIRMDMRSTALSAQVFLSQVDSLAIRLSALFRDRTARQYKNDLMQAWQRGDRYYLVRRGVSYAELKKLKTFPIWRLGRYEGGFIYVQDNLRIKPHQHLASRTIGYLTKGPTGNVVGIEGAYDQYLSGVTGVRLMQRLAGGVWMPVNDGNEVEPRDGMDVITTINITLQDVAHNALLRQLIRHDAHHGTAILMEVSTGAIKAMVNLEKDSDGTYRELYNYAIGESTEPGSTFKLPVLMAALEDGVIDLNDSIDTGEGEYQIYDKTIRDTRREGYGKITVREVFEVSSNVGVAKIIYENYRDHPHDLIDRLISMNLNKKLGVEIKGEGTPMLSYPGDKYWSGISLAMISHGYEVMLTPLQILTFYNAVANNGKMVKPKFVEELRYRGKKVRSFGTQVLNPSICSSSTIEKARTMLEGVVENGTAMNLKNPYYRIAGKTGTAQIANKNVGYRQESKVSYQASFVGYFPADHPKYSCMVVINSPSNSVYYGNLVAGPVFREIADKVYATSLDMHPTVDRLAARGEGGVPYSKNGSCSHLVKVLETLDMDYRQTNPRAPWIIPAGKDTVVDIYPLEVTGHLVPNVVEMGLQDALYLLEKQGLRVRVKGRGKIRNQSIPPGTPVKPGQEILLEMSFV
ncbi:MAG TPA: PASTA domain-containing protein [Bacteroidetes bacterium]|nr:PASTA domain-containing protein [Bacteroidota bacterium]